METKQEKASEVLAVAGSLAQDFGISLADALKALEIVELQSITEHLHALKEKLDRLERHSRK